MKRTVPLVIGLLLLAGLVGVDSASAGPGAIASVQSGLWTEPATWGGAVPTAGQEVTISPGHVVSADPNANFLLFRSANLIVRGELEMKPANASIKHVVHFTGINEGNFQGGDTMEPMSTDVGIWVVGAGKLDLVGTTKTAWQRSGSLAAGATEIPFYGPNTGWNVGDRLLVVPTEHPSVGTRSWEGFEERLVKQGSTANIIKVDALSHAHPVVNGSWYPEVLNLTRNVLIEGEATGRSHIFIRSTSPAAQRINYVELRHMGVEGVSGRYPLHFHHSGDNNFFSLVEGTVIWNAGHHAYVPHMSNGIVFRNTIAYNVAADAYWWDPPPHSECPDPPQPGLPHCPPSESNYITYDRAVAAKVRHGGTGPSNIPHSSRAAGFELSNGTNNTVVDSVAVGVWGGPSRPSGFEWPEGSGGPRSVWDFDTGNRTHNNERAGIFVWQNTEEIHPLVNFATFHNGELGVDHGAYVNNYHYEGCISYANGNRPFQLRASGKGPAPERLHIIGCTLDGAFGSHNGVISDAALVSDDNRGDNVETLVKDTTLKNAVNGLWVADGTERVRIDLVCVTFHNVNVDVNFDNTHLGSRVRIQSCGGTTAEQIDNSGPGGTVQRYPIGPFYPYTG